MPLPLIPIVIGIGAAAGLFGAGKAVKAAVDSSDADDINDAARRQVDRSQRKLKEAREASNTALQELGRKKLGAVTQNLNRFVTLYGHLKNVELSHQQTLDGLLLHDFNEAAFAEIRNDVSLLESSALGLGAGATGGALAAFGAFNGTMLLASAGTGTAITSLSGVAATNATLAWLGGGTLAAGGMGMAGGMMVLGSLAAGPALLIFGSVLGHKADEKLNDARSNREAAETYEKQNQAVVAKLIGINHVARLAEDVLSDSRTACRRASNALEKVIEHSGTDFRSFSPEEKDVVFRAVKTAQLVKAIVDTPILDKDGNLLGDTQSNLGRFHDALAG